MQLTRVDETQSESRVNVVRMEKEKTLAFFKSTESGKKNKECKEIENKKSVIQWWSSGDDIYICEGYTSEQWN